MLLKTPSELYESYFGPRSSSWISAIHANGCRGCKVKWAILDNEKYSKLYESYFGLAPHHGSQPSVQMATEQLIKSLWKPLWRTKNKIKKIRTSHCLWWTQRQHFPLHCQLSKSTCWTFTKRKCVFCFTLLETHNLVFLCLIYHHTFIKQNTCLPFLICLAHHLLISPWLLQMASHYIYIPTYHEDGLESHHPSLQTISKPTLTKRTTFHCCLLREWIITLHRDAACS